MSDPPKALTPAKLPWPARTIAEAMPWFTQKHNNGVRFKRPPRPKMDVTPILADWDAGWKITAIGMKYGISNKTVRRIVRANGRAKRV